MGNELFIDFIEEEIEDLQEAVLSWGVYGLLERFEQWLDGEGYLNYDKEDED